MDTMEEADREAERYGRYMAERDRYARLLGITLEAVGAGRCRATLRISPDMVNGYGTTHGGATFSLADFAFGVASNSRGRVAVALATQMSFPAASRPGDTLVAEAHEESLSGRTGLYRIEVRRQHDAVLVGLFTGTVFRRSATVELDAEDEAEDNVI
jgi:acyl-CoA thioesterase